MTDFGLPPDIVGATFGGLGVVEVAGLESQIPDNVILGVQECLQQCNISYVEQPTLQREPRNSANALPSGFNGPPSAAAATPVAAASVSAAAVPSQIPVPSALSSAFSAISAYAANSYAATPLPTAM